MSKGKGGLNQDLSELKHKEADGAGRNSTATNNRNIFELDQTMDDQQSKKTLVGQHES